MLDELDRLRAQPPLTQLLAHYVRVANPDREAWQDRVTTLEGSETSQLSKLHGDLLAFGWIEWTSSPKHPTACYRVTSDGVRALRLVGDSLPEKSPRVCGFELPAPKAPGRKRNAAELVATDA